MIKNSKVWEEFERELIKKERLSYKEALKIFEGLWEEGNALGVLPPSDALEGIEVDIQIAKILNSCSKNS
ncbi:MAG: hypothetical protein WA148_06305 [Actinomycetota bacterium]